MQAEIDWLQQLGTSENDGGNAVVVDSDNYYIYATGYNTSSGSLICWVAKFYAKSGEQIWSKQLSDVIDASTSLGDDLAVDDDNVYVLIRDYQNKKTLVTKLDLDAGEVVWTYNFEYASGAVVSSSSIVTDGSGYLYVTGSVIGSMLSSDGDTLTSTGTRDTWIAKLSTDQELDWIQQFGSSESESYCMDLAVDGSGNVYAVGYTTGAISGTNASNNQASEDVWIAKYNSEGNRQWIEQFGSASDQNEQALGVAVDDSGGVYATGTTKGDLKEGVVEATYQNFQSWVAKFQASTGEQLWLNQFGGQDAFNLSMGSISVDNDGGVYLGGSTEGQLEGLEPVTTRDALIAKYNAYTGEQLWLKQVSSSDDNQDFLYNMTIGSDGSLYVAGLTKGDMSETETNQGSDDIWIAQLREVPQDYDELAQVLKRYIDYKVSQSTETVLETSETTSTTST
ncbi:MAG: PQQ-binding-like beta-propeller repeat protein, partial [Symploca sp. SIO1C4]|nr:PQQ-binding-like beta-propeller repeat protein [Symploca sp. SIO1C4]